MATSNTKDNFGSSKKIQQEVVTPYKLTVAVLIKCYCEFKDSDQIDNLSISEKVKFRKSFCILSLKILQGPDLKLTELKNMFSPLDSLLPVIEKFDQILEELYSNNIGHLLDIIDGIKQIINEDLNASERNALSSNTVVWKSSVIGYFLRRFIMYFEKLNFSEVIGLYQAYKRYFDDWKTRQPPTITTRHKLEEWYIDEKHWSKRQAELFMATQAALLQYDEGEALSPSEMQHKITSILKSNPDLAEAHFMSFLNYLRVEEFCGAMQSLFHCFDRRTNPDGKYYDEKSKEHRYAALNLCILYHHFGHIDDALACLKEAIKIAHEANDNMCLQHALSWLYRLSNANKDNLIVQCVIKTFELNMSYTTSLSLQSFAQYGSAKTSVKPNIIFETLTKSDMLNCQHNYKDLIFNNNTMKAALWRLYGKTDMSLLWSQTLLYLNIDTNTHTTSHYGEGYLQAVCNLALNLLLEGEYNLVHTLLQYAKRKYPKEPQSRIWMLVENWAMYTRAFHHENWLEAESAARKIIVWDKWEGYLKLAELYLYQQDYAEANKCLDVILKNYNQDEHLNDGKFCLLRAKILMAEIQFVSSYPNLSTTLLDLNSCLVEAEKSELAYYVALILLHIAHVLLQMEMTSQAIKVLNNPKCMIEILANGGQYDKSRATFLYAKCLIADSNKLDAENRAKVIKHIAKNLDKVKSGFLKIESFFRAKDVLFLQAHLFNVANMRAERNNCSLEYRLMDEEHKTKNIHTLLKYL